MSDEDAARAGLLRGIAYALPLSLLLWAVLAALAFGVLPRVFGWALVAVVGQ